MQAFTTLTGVAAPLPVANVDTDQILPGRFLKTVRRTGLGRALFHTWRFRKDGTEDPAFILNKPAFRTASILIAHENFGCGSSREHAPWALLDFGIRCIIAPSFGEIFHNNSLRNGILPVVLPRASCDTLMLAASAGENARIQVDLERQEVRGPEGDTYAFTIAPLRRERLLAGLDDIGETLTYLPMIEGFEAARCTGDYAWLPP